MPTYDYACPACGPFEARRAIAERDVPAGCPRCGLAAPRAWLAAPRLADMPAERRGAFAVNERAAHAPQRSGDYARLRHPAGCGCCAAGRGAGAARTADGAKGFPGRRPWMISH